MLSVLLTGDNYCDIEQLLSIILNKDSRARDDKLVAVYSGHQEIFIDDYIIAYNMKPLMG